MIARPTILPTLDQPPVLFSWRAPASPTYRIRPLKIHLQWLSTPEPIRACSRRHRTDAGSNWPSAHASFPQNFKERNDCPCSSTFTKSIAEAEIEVDRRNQARLWGSNLTVARQHPSLHRRIRC